jgi:hypothetical protein
MAIAMTIRPVLALLLLAGCPAVTSANDNDPDLLIGTWRELPSQNDGDVPTAKRAVLTVTDDMMSIVHADGSSELAAYTADDETLSVSGTASGKTFSQTGPYLVTRDRLLVGAILPTGRTDGVVGSWHADLVLDAEHVALDLELRADNTVHYDRESTTRAAEIFEGTWTAVGDDVKLTIPVRNGQGQTVNVNLFLKQLPGQALGDELYERL